ncbi:MAG: periplasmic heavy metal sensor, partial [Thermoanaerobaculia bacterium]
MKRILSTILCSLVLLAATSARAQGHPGGPPPPGGPGGPGPSPEAVATFLRLTDSQKAALGQLHEALEARVEPLRAQEKANHEQLEAALSAAAPDAAAIGRLVIAGKAIRTQLEAAHDAFDAGFTALLTDEQQARLAIFKEVLEALRPH